MEPFEKAIIELFGLSRIIYHALRQTEIHSLDQLLDTSEDELLNGVFTEEMVTTLKEALAVHGLRLRKAGTRRAA